MGRKKKTSKGKQKIEMKKLESEDARHVCFSKRKAGLFSKASELATLCGAGVVILVDSPAGTPYSFGSPAVNPIIDRFMSRGLNLSALNTNEAQPPSVVQELNNRCMEMSNQLDAAKRKKAMLEDRLTVLAEANQQVQRAENIEELNLSELKQMEQLLYGLKEKIHLTICKNLSERASSSSVANHVTTLNLFGPGTSQAGSTVNPSARLNLPALEAEWGNPSGSKLNLFPMANPFEHGEVQLGQTLNLTMLQNTSNIVHCSEPSVNQPGPNVNLTMMQNTASMVHFSEASVNQPTLNVVNPAKPELDLLGLHAGNSGAVENPNEPEANHHESSGDVAPGHRFY